MSDIEIQSHLFLKGRDVCLGFDQGYRVVVASISTLVWDFSVYELQYVVNAPSFEDVAARGNKLSQKEAKKLFPTLFNPIFNHLRWRP